MTEEDRPGWGVETGEDSEKEAGSNTWSYFAGEYLTSSITTAPDLEVWYGEQGSSGAYFVASKALAQYSDYELTHSLFNANKSAICTVGSYEDYDRPPYSGKMQTWENCNLDAATVYTLAASPEGRECVVALTARVSKEADREAVRHLIDTFEVDCGRVTSEPLAASPSASPAASASPTASSTATETASPAPERNAPNPNAPRGSLAPASPPGGGDINCDQVDGPVWVGANDPNNLDGDDDGWGC